LATRFSYSPLYFYFFPIFIDSYWLFFFFLYIIIFFFQFWASSIFCVFSVGFHFPLSITFLSYFFQSFLQFLISLIRNCFILHVSLFFWGSSRAQNGSYTLSLCSQFLNFQFVQRTGVQKCRAFCGNPEFDPGPEVGGRGLH
jgi:hypothetical protein